LRAALPYTLCFVFHRDQVLLLNRQLPPNMGLWNGLGGKVEAGESPEASVRREVWEEAGIALKEVRFAGIVTWQVDSRERGMYVFIANLPHTDSPLTPSDTEEGILAWKQVEWVLHPKNVGVVSHIPHFLPVMLNDTTPYRFHCLYESGRLVKVERMTLDTEPWCADQMV
jgi:8-oxo-dGTP diphosphatase